MKKIWLGIYFTSMMWLYLLPIFTMESWIYIILLFAGLIITVFSFSNFTIEKINVSLYILIPLLIFILLIPSPYNIGAILLLIGTLSFLFLQRFRISHSVSIGLSVTGIILLAQTFIHPFYFHFASRYHKASFLNPFLSFLLKFAGLTSSFDNNSLIFQSWEGTISVITTWESLGLYPALNYFVGSTVVLIIFSKNLIEKLFNLIAIFIGYGVFRYAILLFFVSDSSSISVFWKPHWVILSFFALPFILMKFLNLERERAHSEIKLNLEKLKLTHLLFLSFTFFSFFFFIGFTEYNDPGERKEGKVLIDEAHSNWEWTEKAYDTEWYGEKSGYNYYCLRDFLNHYFFVEINKEEITSEMLSKYDILIVKTPTKSFSNKEIFAIKDFVKNGGGLFLIGDHTNVFGMGTYLNSIAKMFGFRFRYDATYDLSTTGFSLYSPKKLLLSHPVVHNMPFFLFATSCTLDAPFLSESIIIGYGLKAIKADYSNRNFFPRNPVETPEIEFGLFLQMAGKKHKKGRVLLFTDSTCFSNFSMFMKGKPELILGSMEWLNRKNKYNFLNKVFLMISLISIGFSIFIAKKIEKKNLLFLFLCSSLFASSFGIRMFEKVNKVNYSNPLPHTKYFRVAFDLEHSSMYLPAREFYLDRKDSFKTFYVWTQRLGIFPEISLKFTDSLKGNDAIVIVNPTKEFREKEIVRFLQYIEGGGNALIIDDPRNRNSSTAYQLLSPLGLGIEYYEIEKGKIVDRDGKEIWNGEHLGKVSGGGHLLFVIPEEEKSKDKLRPNRKEENRIPVLTFLKKGRGIVVLFGCSYIFSDEVMGTTSRVPDRSLRNLYNLEFWLFRDLLELNRNKLEKDLPLN